VTETTTDSVSWSLDAGIAPYQVTALDADWIRHTLVPGMNAAATHYDLGFRFDVCRIDTHLYSAVLPASSNGTSDSRVRAAIDRLSELWYDELLPEAEQLVADAPTGLDEALDRARRLWELHFLVVFPQLAALSLFDDLCRELLGDQDPFAAVLLAQGLPSRAAEAADALWEVAQDAGGAARSAYLARYGGKSDGLVSVSVPSWREDPAYLDAAIAALLGTPRPAEARLARAADRERRLAEAQARLASWPRAVRDEFDALLAAAQVAQVLHEDHHIAIDEPVTYGSRVALLALDDDLGIGAGIFHLTLEELGAPAGRDLDGLIAAREAEIARHRGATPSPSFGPPPGDDEPTDVVAVALGKMFAPAEARSTADLVVGHPGSPGVARGPVRIVRTLADAHTLRPGEVLVAETTAPPWTPFFERAAAVVTDVGGMLSHSAVVARECGVPAVVGTGDATHRLRDGQLVEVDGAAGTARILP
jgi:rifampicin phosphotransferase